MQCFELPAAKLKQLKERAKVSDVCLISLEFRAIAQWFWYYTCTVSNTHTLISSLTDALSLIHCCRDLNFTWNARVRLCIQLQKNDHYRRLWFTVLRASGLTPKDAYGSFFFNSQTVAAFLQLLNNNIIIVLTGPHNPYCQLGILNGMHFDSLTVKQKDLEVWRKEGLIEGVVSTKVKQATLQPEWNEDFHLWVDSFTHSRLPIPGIQFC